MNLAWWDQHTCYLTKYPAIKGAIGTPKLGMVPGIKELSPKLKRGPLCEPCVFFERQVPVVNPGVLQAAFRSVSLDVDLTRTRVQTWTPGKSIRVRIPIVRVRSLGRENGSNFIGEGGGERTQVHVIESQSGGSIQTGLEGCDPAYHPSADQPIPYTGGAGQVALTPPNRQCIVVANGELLRGNEQRVTFVIDFEVPRGICLVVGVKYI